MASNAFGTLFRITSWGESHGKAIGVVIDGCPPGYCVVEEEIAREMALRRPGASPYTSPRKEPDRVEIYSGVWEGKTTGAPISLIIFNTDVDSTPYAKGVYRPGHVEYTYEQKYGVFDYRGGGRASGRETACRVAAGAVAKTILREHAITIQAYLCGIGPHNYSVESVAGLPHLRNEIYASPVYHPEREASEAMATRLKEVQEEGDSIGGEVEFVICGTPPGLGDPLFERLEANLAKAMLSLPASKGFSMGEERSPHLCRGSEYNDAYALDEGKVTLQTNHAGGTLGGISTGEPIIGRVQFKPPSSIRKPQKTVTFEAEEILMTIPKEGRHDPCVAIRAVPVVEAMAALVLLDALLMAKAMQRQ